MRVITVLMILCLVATNVSALTVELLNTDPAPIVAGEYADVTLRFNKESQDGPAQEVIFQIESSELITPISENGRRVTSFKSGDTVTHTFRLFFSEDLPEGFVDIPVVVQFNGGQFTEDIAVFVQEADSDPELYVGEVRTVPAELLPDTDNNKLYVVLQNLGDKDAELVHAQLVVNDDGVEPSFAFSFIDSVAQIPEGEQAEFEYTIDLDKDARGVIPAVLELRYRAEKEDGRTYETFSSTIPFDLPVSDAPFLTVVNVTYLDSFEAGSTENRVRVAIRNDGEEDADEVRVRALPDISYPFIFELTTEYVASKIEPGEIAHVEFKTEVVRNAPVQEYPITLRLESLVGETRYSQEDTMVLVVNEGRKLAVGQVGMLLIAVAILFSLWLGYQTLKGRKKKK